MKCSLNQFFLILSVFIIIIIIIIIIWIQKDKERYNVRHSKLQSKKKNLLKTDVLKFNEHAVQIMKFRFK